MLQAISRIASVSIRDQRTVLRLGLLLFWLAFRTGALFAQSPTHCDLCGKAFVEVFYTIEDKVSGQRKLICQTCVRLPERCFACGLPIPKDRKSYDDGRHYCARDAATAVLEAAEIQQIVLESEQQLRRLFVDQLEFPDRNLDVSLVDRLHIQTWFSVPGNDFACPNILGFYRSVTNNGMRQHDVRLLSGLTHSGTRATFAHELGHAWLADNLPAGRNLAPIAHEGFCELIAYSLAVQLNDTSAMSGILTNRYTRGQFELFLKARDSYNMQTVLNWVQYGVEPMIDAGDIDHVRRAATPASAAKPGPKPWERSGGAPAESAVAADKFELKGIVGSENRRIALINGRSFAKGETGKVRKGAGLVEIRCEAIEADSVRIVVVATGQEEVLTLRKD